jgi:hypothetical protein
VCGVLPLFIPRAGNYLASPSEFVSVRPSFSRRNFSGTIEFGKLLTIHVCRFARTQTNNRPTHARNSRSGESGRPAKQTTGELSSQFSTHPSSYFLPLFLSLFLVYCAPAAFLWPCAFNFLFTRLMTFSLLCTHCEPAKRL